MVKPHLWKVIVVVVLAATLVTPGVSATPTVFQSPGEISVSPEVLTSTQYMKEIVNKTLTISNESDAPVTFNIPCGASSGLALWNKLGSDDEVLHSEIGENGTIVGTAYAYEPAKHDNGYVRKAVGLNYVWFPASILDNLRYRGTIELWVNPKVPQPVPYAYGAFGLLGARGGFTVFQGTGMLGCFGVTPLLVGAYSVRSSLTRTTLERHLMNLLGL